MARLGNKTWGAGADVRSFSSNISRTDTASAELFTLPPYAVIKQVTIIGAKSDAGTSGRISLGSNGGGGKDFLADFNVKANGVVSYPSSFGAFAGENDPNPIVVTAKYAEDGAASTVGGPWTIIVDLV